MSDVVSFKFDGDKNQWLQYRHSVEKQGSTVQERLSQIIKREIYINQILEERNEKTVSVYRKELSDRIFETADIRSLLQKGHYVVELDDIDFIKSAGFDLQNHIKHAVCDAIYRYWIIQRSVAKGQKPEQALTLHCENKGAKKLQEYIWNRMTVSFVVSCLSRTSLSKLKESDLSNVVLFDCVIIGPSAKKLDTNTNRYIQHMLVQEPELEARENNPMVIDCVVHGDDTIKVSTGQKKRILGFYTVQEPINGQKVQTEKKLSIDVITIMDTEEHEDVTLTAHELQTVKEFALNDETNYISHLIQSFCPKIWGRDLEKFALYLSLLGGSEYPNYRRESHLMLVGEADTGKSELVKFANQISHKSSIIDGSNSTGVGVLFALDEFDKIKILRSGAMILNSGGHLIIDEYDKMPSGEQKKLNQAMEQQRATYNKGGHIGNAETKTTVITACNPHNERWDDNKSFIDNMPFGRSTISRFDIIIRLKHETNEVTERRKLEHILKQRRGDKIKVATPEYIKGLLNHVRKINPIITPEADQAIIDHYISLKFADNSEDKIAVETRQMEGIQRLCEAYAKLTFRKHITREVVQTVFDFYKKCFKTLGMVTDKDGIQHDLRGHSINKDEYFEEIFRNLSLEDDEGNVIASDLANKLLENPRHFSTDRAISSYIENRKKSGWIYEPRVGVYRRQKR